MVTFHKSATNTFLHFGFYLTRFFITIIKALFMMLSLLRFSGGFFQVIGFGFFRKRNSIRDRNTVIGIVLNFHANSLKERTVINLIKNEGRVNQIKVCFEETLFHEFGTDFNCPFFTATKD